VYRHEHDWVWLYPATEKRCVMHHGGVQGYQVKDDSNETHFHMMPLLFLDMLAIRVCRFVIVNFVS
jgi:hypothetical protein